MAFPKTIQDCINAVSEARCWLEEQMSDMLEANENETEKFSEYDEAYSEAEALENSLEGIKDRYHKEDE